ncbi:MAG TPA: DUF4432 family protein [Prolixibacteraceae bacterium]|nr:DUF4432 family protein [Prolixibacteraceae bacterium]
MNSIQFNCIKLSSNPGNKLESGNLKAEIYHNADDPESVNRIRLVTSNAELEIFPSKGLSVGEAFFHGKPVFWEPPIGMPNPETLDLWSDEVAINGKPAPGFTFLKTFNGGIELYGLKNWGMPVEKDGELQLLHGETSNIPVEKVEVNLLGDNKIKITGGFYYKTFKGNPSLPWYKRGSNLCKVNRTIILHNNEKPEIELKDEFENVSETDLFVDWGYHITFKPEVGARLNINASRAEDRSGGPVPDNYEMWTPAENTKNRTEKGIIYRGLNRFISNGMLKNKVLINRPTLGNLLISFTPAPYTQTWMCNGGANSKEFTWSKTGKPLFKKNWDGIGIEIGASALDHNENTNPEVPVATALNPGEKTSVQISVKSV